MTTVVTLNHVGPNQPTLKYERLGRLAMENRRRYCNRHGYRFVGDGYFDPSRPACWSKIPAILDALERDSWVLWADSDCLLFERGRRLDELCDPAYDLVVASHDAFFAHVGIEPSQGYARMPINTGVFLVRATDWAVAFLRETYAQVQFVTRGEVWDGIGEQEAMTWLLRRHPESLSRVKHIEGLQNHPKLYKPGDLFVHFYGNHAPHMFSDVECDQVISQWEEADARGEAFPEDRARFHWCCIQNKRPDAPVIRGDLAHYLYSPDDLGQGARPS